MRERFLVKSFGDNAEGARRGLSKTLELLGTYQSAVIVVPKIDGLKNTLLTKVLPPEHATKLIKERNISFEDGKELFLCSQSTLKNFRRYDVYLDLWGTKFSIKEVEALPSCKAIVMVTWQPDDASDWASEHSVDVIYDDENAGDGTRL